MTERDERDEGASSGPWERWPARHHLAQEDLRRDPASLDPARLLELAQALQAAHLELDHRFEQLRAAYEEITSLCDGYRVLFEYAPIGYLVMDATGRIAHINHCAADLLGSDPQALLGNRVTGHIHAASLEDWAAFQQQLTPRGGRHEVTLRLVDGGRGQRVVQCQALPEPKGEGEDLPRYQVTLMEVTDWYRTLEERDQLLQTVEATSICIGYADARGRVLHQNPAFNQEVGKAPDSAYDAIDGYHPAWAARKVREEALPEAARTGIWQGETAILRADGSSAPAWQTLLAHRDWKGEISTYSTLIQDLTQFRALEALLYEDPLTELPNRMVFLDRLDQALLRRTESGHGVAVIVLDVWDFRSVNNALGNEAGDELLHLLGQRLTQAVAEAGTVARIGGDAFAILLCEVSHSDQVSSMARSVIRVAEAPCMLGEMEYTVRVHLGISTYFHTAPVHYCRGQALLEWADAARREAEQEGVHYRFYSEESSRRDFERMKLITELRRALAEGELELHYQPQCDLDSSKAFAYEALVRWPHPERGWIPPAEFVPVAEQNGLMGELGGWVLERACADAADWLARGREFRRVGINVAAPQLMDPEFPRQVQETLERTGLPADRLEIEITESLVVTPGKEVFERLAALRVQGISVAVDDFGTGYSALSYLVDLPVDRLKIDRSFVQGVAESARKRAIIRTVVSLSRALGLETVAEGIEYETEREALYAEGCRQGQGYLFARPAAVS